MFFKEQARIFVQLVLSKAPLPIFVTWYLPKKELARMLIHIREIYNCKVYLKHRSKCAS